MEAQTKMARHWPPAPTEVSQGSFPNYQIKGIICVTQGSLPAGTPTSPQTVWTRSMDDLLSWCQGGWTSSDVRPCLVFLLSGVWWPIKAGQENLKRIL